MRIPITWLTKFVGDPTIVLVVQINNMIALFSILFVLIVLVKFVQSPDSTGVVSKDGTTVKYAKTMTIIINTAQLSGIKHLQINVRFIPERGNR